MSGWMVTAIGIAAFAAGACVGWVMCGSDATVTRAVSDDEAVFVRDRLLRTLGATTPDLEDLDRGVRVADVTDRIKARGGA